MNFVIALHALALLFHTGQRLSSETIAQNVCCNPVQVRRVMAKCAKAGLLCCTSGVKGGYCLREGKPITLLEVLRALDIQLINQKWETGAKSSPCMVARGMHSVSAELTLGLNAVVDQYLASITIADVEKALGESNEDKAISINDRFQLNPDIVKAILAQRTQG